MAFRIKHIRTRFMIQSISTIILMGILLIVLFISSFNKKQTLNNVSVTKNIESEIHQLDNISQVLSDQRTDAGFVDSRCQKFIDENDSRIYAIIDSIYSLSKHTLLNRAFIKDLSKDSLLETLDLYRQSYELTLLSLKEKGNRYAGKVGAIYSLNHKLIQELRKVPDSGKRAAEFAQMSEAYFAELKYSKLLEYRNLCNTVSESVSNEFPDFGYGPVNDLASQISHELTNIEIIDKRLSDNEKNEGLLPDLTKDHQNLTIYFNKFASDVNKTNAGYFRYWNILFIIITIVLTIFYIILGRPFSSKISGNLKSLVRLTSKLREGDLGETITNNGHFEFETTIDNLKTLQDNLIEKTDFIEKLLSNDFSQQLKLQGKNDNFTKKLIRLREKLLLAQQEQEKRDKDNEVRRYINEGLAKFSDIMRSNSDNTDALGDNLIKELVKYLGALQGGLFLTDENDTEILTLISAFAFDRKKYLTKTFRVGEGLIGTCAIEKKLINLTEVPKDYVLIKSGLGDAPPNNLLIVPVIHEEDLVGVLEITSLKIFDGHEVEMAEQIASSLASTIITVRNNTKTAQLLQKSQQQAAEMAEQEEEMRQNMEELKATQEESTRREEEMQGILDAIGTSFFVIEYDVDGTINHINEKVARFLKEPYDTIIGRKHQDIFSADSSLNSNLFAEITSHKASKNITESLNRGSSKYTYKHYLSPVISRYGEVLKILNILTIDEVDASDNKQ